MLVWKETVENDVRIKTLYKNDVPIKELKLFGNAVKTIVEKTIMYFAGDEYVRRTHKCDGDPVLIVKEKNGLYHGRIYNFSKEGGNKTFTTFNNGVKHGLCRNGKESGTYRMGQKHGVWFEHGKKFYYIEDKRVDEMEYMHSSVHLKDFISKL